MAPCNTNNSKKGTCAAEVHNMSVGASNNTGTIANRNSNDIDTNGNSNEGHVDRFMSGFGSQSRFIFPQDLAKFDGNYSN